jgi:hypothetical protein
MSFWGMRVFGQFRLIASVVATEGLEKVHVAFVNDGVAVVVDVGGWCATLSVVSCLSSFLCAAMLTIACT